MTRSTVPSVTISRRGPAQGDSAGSVLLVRGDHDVATKLSIAAGIARAARRAEGLLLIDLSAVTFMDASTIGAIVESRKRLRARGQSLEVRAPSRQARWVLELCGLADLIQQEPLDPTGAAAALATWVDVPPAAPSQQWSRQRAGALAAERVDIEEGATVGPDSGGP